MVEQEVRVLGPVGAMLCGNWVLEMKPWPATLDLDFGPYSKPSPMSPLCFMRSCFSLKN